MACGRGSQARSGKTPVLDLRVAQKKRPQRRRLSEAALNSDARQVVGGVPNRGLPQLWNVPKRVNTIHQPENGSRNSGLIRICEWPNSASTGLRVLALFHPARWLMVPFDFGSGPFCDGSCITQTSVVDLHPSGQNLLSKE